MKKSPSKVPQSNVHALDYSSREGYELAQEQSDELDQTAHSGISFGLTQGLKRRSASLLRTAGQYTMKTVAIPKAVVPLAQLFSHNQPINNAQLSHALDYLFEHLYEHPITRHTQRATRFLRESSILPNEASTEDLIRFVVNQCVERSPMPVPELVLNEFWNFYNELMSAPELKGLAELSFDVVRYILRTYEPLLLELINLLKETRRINQDMLNELVDRASIVRYDLVIIQRQVKALRYIKPFFQTDPQDFASQAQIVAKMVREFGPFFVKMAQVAASNADFLPDEIARELQVFHEDVDPMTGREVLRAFKESFGKKPKDMYFGFDEEKPMKSGSIGSVYLARRPVTDADGQEALRRVIVKVGRNQLDREFLMGRMTIGLALMSSQYWAPHSKLAPFLQALQDQVEEFVKGFNEELDFKKEAANQQRFALRSEQSRHWHTPKIYRVSERILEMEYLENVTSVQHYIASLPRRKRGKEQRRLARKFLYTMLEHILVYQEFHGDLHPGNLLIDPKGELYLIDWGNTVDLKGKWGPVRDYIVGALAGDVDQLAEAMIAISTQPELNALRKDEIRAKLLETLARKKVRKIGRNNLPMLWKEGVDGLHKRSQAVMHLMSNNQQLGIVPRSEYMHLSRSIAAALGSFASMYYGLPRWMMALDFFRSTTLFPVDLARDRVAVKRKKFRQRLWERIPMPRFLRRKRQLEQAVITGEESAVVTRSMLSP